MSSEVWNIYCISISANSWSIVVKFNQSTSKQLIRSRKVFVVIAIAAVNSWSFSSSFGCPDSNDTSTVNAQTFTLSNVQWNACDGTKQNLWDFSHNAGGSAGFFYFVNVTALVYILIITFVYVVFWQLYQDEKRIALGDLALTALIFILFFFCSSIWWAGSNTLGAATSEAEISSLLKNNSHFWNNTSTESLSRTTNNGKLTISVLANWVCVLSFAMNCWFVWKEVVPRTSENPSSIA